MRTVRKIGLVAAAGLASCAAAFTPTTAAAAPADTEQPPIVTPVSGEVSTEGTTCYLTRWGHQGKFKCPRPAEIVVIDVDWDGNGSRDETFGIAPNREIWHIWQNAGGWKEMPGNGFADQMDDRVSRYHSDRCVGVYVNNKGYYTQVFHDGHWRNSWHANTRC